MFTTADQFSLDMLPTRGCRKYHFSHVGVAFDFVQYIHRNKSGFRTFRITRGVDDCGHYVHLVNW